MITTGLGDSQQRILQHLKRRGASTIPVLADDLGLNVETVRAHVRSLGEDGLVHRSGRRRSGPGRPEIVFELTEAGHGLFPDRGGSLLQDLAEFLSGAGQADLIERFFDERVEQRRAEARERLEGLEGDERMQEVARILSEEGFMAELETDEEGGRVLRLCNCPVRDLVSVSTAPCKAELGLVRELLGQELARVSYMPEGDAACRYTIKGA